MSQHPAAVAVEGHDETASGSVDTGRWAAVAADTLLAEGIDDGRLDVIFVDAEAMAELNREHMGHEGPTDVLSFPIDGPDAANAEGVDASRAADAVAAEPLDGMERHLGDVVVCPEVAERQAPEHAGSVEAELTLLIVHGVLHVLGHDHALHGERVEMQARERLHLARYGIEHPVPAPEGAS
ncbi:MAG: rRNA maturation RNase YbeY [Actinomycetota bacterium]